MGRQAKRRRQQRSTQPLAEVTDTVTSLILTPEKHTTSELAAHHSALIRVHAASRLNLTPVEQDRLANDDNAEVRYALAANPACQPRHGTRFARDTHHRTRLAYATNPNAAPGALATLADDPHPVVATAAAAHTSCGDRHARGALHAIVRTRYPAIDAPRAALPAGVLEAAEARMRRLWGDEIVDSVEILTINDPAMTTRDVIAVAEAITGTVAAAN